jgi:hypothetical protein
MLVKDAAEKGCSTGAVAGLSRQIIAEVRLLAPEALAGFEDLDVRRQGAAVNLYLQPAAKEALRRAIAARGRPLVVASAYRTLAQQYLLRRWSQAKRCGIVLAAAPGRSNHENGLSLDIPAGSPDFAAWRTVLARHGWAWFGPADPPHFTFTAGAGLRTDLAALGIRAFQQLWNRSRPHDPLRVDGLYGPETARRLAISPASGFARAK